MKFQDALIIGRARTPIGSLGGSLSTVPAPQLGAACIKAALERGGVPTDQVSEVIMGNVISAGVGQNPARQAALVAGLDASVGATTINKVCGSGLKAVMLADQSVRLREAKIVVAGGMENMSPGSVPVAECPCGLSVRERCVSRLDDARRFARCLRRSADGHLRRPVCHEISIHSQRAGRFCRWELPASSKSYRRWHVCGRNCADRCGHAEKNHYHE